jgi:hypothetical protein
MPNEASNEVLKRSPSEEATVHLLKEIPGPLWKVHKSPPLFPILN